MPSHLDNKPATAETPEQPIPRIAAKPDAPVTGLAEPQTGHPVQLHRLLRHLQFQDVHRLEAVLTRKDYATAAQTTPTHGGNFEE